MLTAACGWALLRTASPGRAVRSAVAAARPGGGARRLADPTFPRAARGASPLSGLPPSPPRGRNHGPLSRLRSPAEARLAAAWASAVGGRSLSASARPGQPSCSRSGHEGGGPGSAGSSEQESPGQAPREEGQELYENPWTIPNFLSMARIGLAPVLGYLIVEEDFNIALGVFALAGITDLAVTDSQTVEETPWESWDRCRKILISAKLLPSAFLVVLARTRFQPIYLLKKLLLDGFIARNWANQKSVLGSALDPLADKFLISILYVSLTCANLIPVPLTSMVILRDAALIAAVFYVRYKTLPPPRTISKYFNPCYATAQLKPTFISKVNTVVQLVLVAASLAAPVFNYVDSMYLQTLWCITACTTTASAYSYYHYGRKTVQVLNSK